MPADPAAAQAFVRDVNRQAAELMQRHAGRFGLFAALSMTGPDQALRELETAFDDYGADGIGLLTNYQGVRLGEPVFDPVLAELNRRNAVLFVHPIIGNIPTPRVYNLAIGHTEMPFEATRTIASLLFNGSFDKYPNIRFIFTHGGGAVPMLVDRWAQMARQFPSMSEQVPEGVNATLARHHYDLATVAHPTPFASLSKMAPMNHLLFGSDHPFLPIAAGARGLGDLGLSADQYKAIARENALALFPRLAARSASA